MDHIIKTGKSRQSGFTIIELLVVISMIGILATFAVPSFKKSIIRAKETSLRNSLYILRDVIDQFYADHGQYPDTLENLVQKKYIRDIPEDPFVKSRDAWILIPPDFDDLTGIYDIRSSSKKISLHGTPYNEW